MILAALAPLAPARAQGPAVILVDPDPVLLRAVATALRPWEAEVRSVTESSPGASMPGSAARGQALAQAHDALAVVWISADAEGFALWVYDRREDRVIARALPSGPPFDEPTAAEVALAVKTLLRHGPVAPDAARLAAPAPPVVVWIAARGGARLWSTEPADVEARFGIDVALWPAELDEHLGVGLRVTSGPGLGIASASFAGRWTDTEASVFLAGRLAFAPVELGAAVFFGAHLTTLEGRVTVTERSATELRIDPITGLELSADVRLDRRARLGLAASMSLPLTTQRYLAGTDVVLELQRVNGTLALVLGLGLP